MEPVYLEARQSEPETTQPKNSQRRSIRSRSGYANVSARSENTSAAALPELKRVIVAFGNRVVMKTNLDAALATLLGGKVSETGEPPPGMFGKAPVISGSAEKALDHFNRARAFLRQGDWSGYGKELKTLETILKQMAEGRAVGAKTP